MPGTEELDAACILSAVRQESRKAVRFPMGSFLRVVRLGGQDEARSLSAKGLDLSATGLGFLSPEPLELAMQVRVELPYSRLSAMAAVRHCERSGASWRVGVELVGLFGRSWENAQ
jgi:PilZ domain